MVISEGSIPAMDSVRTSRVKPKFVRFSRKERIWNVRLHDRENHIRYALFTLRGTPLTETVIIPWKIRKYDRKSDKLVAPKCQKRLLAESREVLVEDLKRWNKIQRYEGDRMNPEEERVLQYKEKENKLGKDLVCWVHPQDGQ